MLKSAVNITAGAFAVSTCGYIRISGITLPRNLRHALSGDISTGADQPAASVLKRFQWRQNPQRLQTASGKDVYFNTGTLPAGPAVCFVLNPVSGGLRSFAKTVG